MSQTIFLSTVTREFGDLRRRLAAICARTKRVHVRHQDDFVQRGVLTLHVLEEEIRQSDLVVHLIGETSGWVPPREQVDDLLRRLPEFAAKFSDVAEAGRQGEISATQWEAWLALYFHSRPGSDLRLCLYKTADSRTQRESGQAAHLQRLQFLQRYPREVPPGGDPFDEIVASLIELGCLTEAERRRIVHLPYPPLGTLFKGRDAFLSQLRQSLERTTVGAATATTGKAVHGLGGVGKTRLAVEYAWQHAEQYSAVLFVSADTPAGLRQNLAELTGPLALDLPQQDLPEEQARVAAALRWLHDHPGWFLILDNVDTEDAADFAEDLLSRLHGGQVLITSRLGKWSGSVEPLELDVLAEDAAAGFLLERTDPKRGSRGRLLQDEDAATAAELARELDGLALEQAAAYICQNRMPLSDYLLRWRSHTADVQQWHDRRTMKYPHSVAVTWQTTLDELEAEEAAVLNVLAWLAPEPIPLTVTDHLEWKSLPARPASSESRQTSPTDGPAFNLRSILANLADYSMIRWDTQADSISVHRVVQEILRTRQTEPTRMLTAALQMLNAAAPKGDPGDVRTWPEWEPLRPHVAFAVAEADRREIAEPTTVLMGELSTLLLAKALHAEAERLDRRALAIDEQRCGPGSPEVALRLNSLAQYLQGANRLAEAEPLMTRAVTIFETSLGANHPHVATALNNLAQLFQATNRFAEAEPLMKRALHIDEQSYDPDHPDVARDLNHLALLLRDTNRLAEAQPLMRRALEIFAGFERRTGHEHARFRGCVEGYRSILCGLGLPPDDITRRIQEVGGE